MTPKEVIEEWIDAFNRADIDALISLYNNDAINHQVVNEPVIGRIAIQKMFEKEFAEYTMVCIVENIFEDGNWIILEWKDLLGLRGCGFFHIVNDTIIFQRGYWDRLSFQQVHHSLV